MICHEHSPYTPLKSTFALAPHLLHINLTVNGDIDYNGTWQKYHFIARRVTQYEFQIR